MLTLILAAAGLCAVNVVDWNALIRSCLDKSGYSMKEACYEMGIDRAQFERQLGGEGHLSLKRLGMLKPTFHRWFAVEMARQVGLPDELHTARQLDAAIATERVA